MEVTFRPISNWPADFSRQKHYGNPFRTPWGQTLELLQRELDKLGATNVVIEAGFREGDIRIDGWPRSNARVPQFPGVIVSFDSKHGSLRYGTDAFPHWEANVRAIALGLEALRKVDRYGIGRRGEQYQGWKQLASGTEGLRERGMALIEEHGAARALKLTHPDTRAEEFDDDDFRAVQLARGGS